MLENMTETGIQLAERDIVALENSLGVRLPSSYRSFLLKYNGGRPTPEYFPIQNYAPSDFGGIQLFFGLKWKIKSCNLDWEYSTMSGRFPGDFLPIAGDDTGNLLCMKLKGGQGTDEGVILYWDHEDEHSPPTHDNLFFVARSFEALLESLHHRDMKLEIAKAQAKAQRRLN